jgi:N utilization substance protein B
MTDSREIRRLAFQTLFQIDARGGADADAIRLLLEAEEGLSPARCREAFELARRAYEAREAADHEFEMLAPDWPVHRQAAVDRAILRLGHYLLTLDPSAGPRTISCMVDLAREYSTDRSPAFVNALLDKVYKRLIGGA